MILHYSRWHHIWAQQVRAPLHGTPNILTPRSVNARNVGRGRYTFKGILRVLERLPISCRYKSSIKDQNCDKIKFVPITPWSYQFPGGPRVWYLYDTNFNTFSTQSLKPPKRVANQNDGLVFLSPTAIIMFSVHSRCITASYSQASQ